MASPAKLAGSKHWDRDAKGTPEDLSAEQRELVDEFLKRCPVELIDKVRFSVETPLSFACRMLRARKFVVDDAVKLVHDTAAWREKERIDELKRRDPYDVLGCLEDEVQFWYRKAYVPAFDKAGRPIYSEIGGVVDVEAMFMLTDERRLQDYHIYSNEVHMANMFEAATAAKAAAAAAAASVSSSAPASPRNQQHPISTLMAIVDMSGMSLSLITATARNFILGMVRTDSAYYPETLGYMAIINVPAFFATGWKLITPFLDERTTAKIDIIGPQSAWQPRLLQMVDAAALPTEYGGQLVIPGGLYKASRTRHTELPKNKSVCEYVPTVAGKTMRCKWFCRPGDIRFTCAFIPGPLPPGLTAGVGAIVAGPAPALPAAASVLHPLQDHPHSDKQFVIVTHTAPCDGYYRAVYDNNAGWRHRDVYHRWDEMREGRPVEPPGQSRSAVELVSAAAAPAEGGAAAAAGGAGGDTA